MPSYHRPLNPKHLEWFISRGLDPELVVSLGIYSARPDPSGAEGWNEPIPSGIGPLIVWPYIDGGREVGAKYRLVSRVGGEKRFFQRPGGRKTFWNIDCADDPEVQDGRQALVITEGECDAMTALQIGHPWAVSVPDGAPAHVDQHGQPIPMQPDSTIDPVHDAKFAYVFNNWDRLKRCRRIILATDSDGPGMRLRDELARRLGRERCLHVDYPSEAVVPTIDEEGIPGRRPPKDLNEVLLHCGPEVAREVLLRAKLFPVRGLYRLSDYPDVRLATFKTGWSMLDKYLKLYEGELVVVTGIPGHGKSSWVFQLCSNLAEAYGWTTGLFSPEMPVVAHTRDKLRLIRNRGREVEAMHLTDEWIERQFVFMGDDPHGAGEAEPMSVEWLLDVAGKAVIRDGIRVLVIDPWNEVEHAKDRNESMHDYIGRSLRAVKRFGQQYGVTCIVVAHPIKDVGRGGEARPPTLYDVDGSSHWFNKADHGVVLFRDDETTSEVIVRIAKVRQDGTGEKGQVRFWFDLDAKRFEPLLIQAPSGDGA